MKGILPAVGISLAVVLAGMPASLGGDTRQTNAGGFVVEHEIVLPANPEAVYDALTGDISGWWDHTFSKQPKKLYIEARPGGGFYEIFNDAGDGVRHATVIYAERGKRLRFVGPLGFSGQAVELVTTFDLKADPPGTRLHLTCSVLGQISEGWDKQVDAVWHHFLFDRLKQYIESGQYLKRKR